MGTNEIDFTKFFEEFTPETVTLWEKTVSECENPGWRDFPITGLIPFVRKVLPRVARVQSLFGPSIICLEDKPKPQEEEAIVRYGLEPLLKANILTDGEVQQIVDWYLSTQPTWDAENSKRFQKVFDVDGTRYELMTDSYRNCRDLNLHYDRKE